MVEDEMVEDGKENYNGDLAGGLYTPKLRDSPPENQKIEDRVSANDRVIAHPRSSSNNYYVHNVFSFDLQANVGGLRVRVFYCVTLIVICKITAMNIFAHHIENTQ